MTDRARSIEAVGGIPSLWLNKCVFQHPFIHSLKHSREPHCILFKAQGPVRSDKNLSSRSWQSSGETSNKYFRITCDKYNNRNTDRNLHDVRCKNSFSQQMFLKSACSRPGIIAAWGI